MIVNSGLILIIAFYIFYKIMRFAINISDFGMPYPFGKRVFKVNLLSVTPDIKVYKNFSKTKNITSADKKIVTTLFVQRALKPHYYREIITGKLIPATKTFMSDDIISHPVYIPKLRSNFNINYEEVKVYDELTKYLEERQNGYKGYNSFKDYLDMLFENADKYYNDAKAKNEISDSKKIACMLKQKI